MTGRILVAGGSEECRQDLRSALELGGYLVAEADTVAETVQMASEQQDVVVMDSSIDGISAHHLCRTIRTKTSVGIIVIGDRTGTCAIDALNAGADEYVASPFIVPELVARVRALLRRVARPDREEIVLQDRTIDMRSRKVRGNDGRVSHLTPKEFLVLRCLLNPVNKPNTHHHLAQTVWQRDARGEVEYMRVVVKQLRRKLEPDPENPRYILTERAIGYRFHAPSRVG